MTSRANRAPTRDHSLAGTNAEPSAAEFIRETVRGQRCADCGEPTSPGAPCEACADKAALLHAFLKGDA